MWRYEDHSESDIALVHPVTECIYCGTSLLNNDHEAWLLLEAPPFRLMARAAGYGGTSIDTRAEVCPCCGWWKYTRYFDVLFPNGLDVFRDGHFGILKRIDISSTTAPYEEVLRYLAAKYDDRFEVHPRKFEEVVAAVFRGLGYETRVTSYSKDGGIDVFLDGPDDSVIGVEVKRWRKSIAVAQIRQLTGALVLRGVTQGVFVTTSSFTGPAREEADLSAVRGIPIELFDAPRLFDALKLVRTRSYEDDAANPPWQGFKDHLADEVGRDIESRHEVYSREAGGEENDLVLMGKYIHDEEDRMLMALLRSRDTNRSPH
jgi:restriction system protein